MRTFPDADVVSFENEIDRVVYSLYGLTAEEIVIIDNNMIFIEKLMSL